MHASILQKAQALGFSSALFAPAGEGSVLLLFCTYRLYGAPPPPGRIALSNYYIASNRGYHLAKQMLAYLQEQGIAAKNHHPHGIKQIAASALGAQGKNTLFYHPVHGSYTSIQAIDTTLPADAPPHAPQDFCGSCTLCAQACPTGAITPGGFLRERCVRNYCNEAAVPPEYGTHIYQLFGCEKCQRACPKNEAVYAEAHTFDLIDVLRGSCTKDIRKLVGANYGRRAKILNQALFYAANTGYTAALPAIEALTGDAQAGEAARYALRVLEQLYK